MLFWFLLYGTQGVYAQDVVKAVVDNYIVAPATSTTLNVLKNDELSCHTSEVTITIATPPGHGTASVRANKTISYRVANGYFGPDSFVYKIVYNGKSSTATVYINSVANVPDNMMPEVCAVDPEAFTWEITVAQASTAGVNVTVARSWLAGNLGGGDASEIVAHGFETSDMTNPNLPAYWAGMKATNAYYNTITIFKDGNLSDGKEFPVIPYCPYYSICPFGLSRFANGKGALIVAGLDGYMHAYEYSVSAGGVQSLTYKWKSSTQFIYTIYTTSTNSSYTVGGMNIHANGPTVGFADFNKDGVPEVYVGNKIFDVETGAYLCGGDVTHRGFSIQNNIYGSGAVVSVALDYDLDGNTELVCGNAIYKPTYDSGTDTWTMPKVKTITPPTVSTGAWEDGQVSIVDMNNDGYPDALIQTTRRISTRAEFLVYGWDMKNNTILFRYHKTGAATAASRGVGTRSVAFIGDIDGDGKPEIAFIEEELPQAEAKEAWLKAFKLPTVLGPTASLEAFWSMKITEAGGRTGISLFDFNLDGISELLYRDEVQLRIIDGSLKKKPTPYNLAAIPSTSATTWEMPIVLDVDGDGAAEIICAGGEASEPWAVNGKMKIFKSGNASQWAPARTVWNQYAYNPTFVNEDLTIPIYPVNPSASFYGADGTIRRPFNNFLQQAPIMTGEGVSLQTAPNLNFDANYQLTLYFNETTGAATVSCSVMNAGDFPFTGAITLQLYTYDGATTTYTKIGTQASFGTTSSVLAVNGTQTCSFNISGFLGLLPANYTSWFLVINSVDAAPNAPTFFKGMKECIEADNMTSSISLVREERVMCENAVENIVLPDRYSYRWFSSLTSTTPLATEAEGTHVRKHTKDNSKLEYYFVQSFVKNDFTKPISTVRDTIFVYLTPDSLIWKGTANEDWHDSRNWENPADLFNKYPKANVPRLCTSVLIEDNTTKYPILLTGKTSYSNYTKAECHNIHFRHGGEVSNPDLLTYTNAFVEVDIASNRWVMFSPPLKQLYSGDIYVKDKNPYSDDVFVGTRLFAQKNPQTGYTMGSWSGKYNNPEKSFEAGEGVALWVDDKDYSYDPARVPHNPILFKFPKYDTMHHIYDSWGVPEKNISITKGMEHRFIFDNMPNSAKNFAVDISNRTGQVGAGDKYVLVGNPFMAHLDFTKFVTANSALIYDSYQVIDETGDTKTYAPSGGTLQRYIPPMQSFLVRLKSTTSTLLMNGNMTANVSGHKLRSSQEEIVNENSQENMLFINLANGNATTFESNASIILRNSGKNSYKADEDVPKLLFTYDDYLLEPSGIYTESLDDDKFKLAINTLDLSSESLRIPLGIRSVKAGQDLSFFIHGQWNFAIDKTLYLYDKLKDQYFDIRESSWFYFKNDENQANLDRFEVLVGVKNVSGIEESNEESSVKIQGYVNSISVESAHNIDNLRIYDLQGRLVASKKNLGNKTRVEALTSGVYVVEVGTSDENVVRKIFVY